MSLTILLAAVAVAAAAASDLESRVRDLVVEHEASLAVQDPESGTLYGLVRGETGNDLVAIDAETGRVRTLRELPEITGLPDSGTAIDPDGRIFVQAFTDESTTKRLYVVDTVSGEVLSNHQIDDFLINLEFDSSSGRLYGLAAGESPGKRKLIGINPSVAPVDEVSSYEITYDLSGYGPFAAIDPVSREYVFAGFEGSGFSLFAIHLLTGEQRRLTGSEVPTGGYRVGKVGPGEMLYTVGAETCTVVSGFDPTTGNAFVTHFTPDETALEEALADIDHQLRLAGSDGIGSLQLAVVGGRYSWKGGVWSSGTLLSVYRSLVEEYGVDFSQIHKDHSGRVFSLMVRDGAMEVF